MQQATAEAGGDAGLALVHHAMKRTTESDAALARATLAYADHWAYVLAEVHAYCGEIDQALAWLDRGPRSSVSRLACRGRPLVKDRNGSVPPSGCAPCQPTLTAIGGPSSVFVRSPERRPWI
jgi:hypothetical protein